MAGFLPPLSHDLGCPSCGHDHLWLDCDWCGCSAHVQTGITLTEGAHS